MIVLRSCIVDLGGGRKENRATWKGRKMIVFLFVYISKIFHSIFDIHFYSTFMVVTHDQNKHCFLHHVFPHIPLSCAIYDPRRSVERKQLVCQCVSASSARLSFDFLFFFKLALEVYLAEVEHIAHASTPALLLNTLQLKSNFTRLVTFSPVV